MEKIGIVVDEADDLPKEMAERHQIAIVPVKLDWPEIENLPGENTFQKMRELEKRGIKSFGKTSQPSPKDFLDKYKEQFQRFEKIISITITSKLSGTYNSAIQAKNFLKPEEKDRVFVVDSLNASGGEALLALKAVDLIKSGKEIEEIVRELEKFVPQIHTYIIFNDPKWIEASGRISPLVANLLKRLIKVGIRSLLTFKNGLLVPAGMKTGAKDIPITLFRKFEKENKKMEKEQKRVRIVITHGDDPEGAERLKEMIEKEFKNVEFAFINIINNIVGVVAGPNSLVLAWCEV